MHLENRAEQQSPDLGDFPHHGFYPDRDHLLALGEAKAVEIRDRLELAGLSTRRVALGGSLVSGLHFGPRTFSKHFECGSAEPRFEIDIEVSGAIPAEALRGCFPEARIEERTMDMWRGFETVAAILWEERRSGWVIEWDVLVAGETFYSLAAAMPLVFSPVEIAWHRELRSFAASESPEAYDVVKADQMLEARWRIAASYGMSRLGELAPELGSAMPALPLTGELPDAVRGAVAEWLAGESGSVGVHRPSIFGSFELQSAFERERGETRPEDPGWTKAAERIQWVLQSRRLQKEQSDEHGT